MHLSPYLSYVSGALAGCAATIGSYPFDLLRTILASQGEPKVRLIYIWSVKLLYFCLNTSGLSGCVIDRRDGKSSVKGIKVLCLVGVCLGFQQEGNSEFLGPATTFSNPCRGVIIGRAFLSEDEWMHLDPSSLFLKLCPINFPSPIPLCQMRCWALNSTSYALPHQFIINSLFSYDLWRY